MDQDSVYNQEELDDITPYENYVSAIRDSETKRHYQGQLEMFLNPNYEWNLSAQKRRLLSEKELAVLVNGFVNLLKRDPNAGRNRIKRYIMKIKKEVEEGKLNPNTSHNRLKSIKMMLRANEIDFSWYLIDKMMPKEKKSEDRAYTQKEIHSMMTHCVDIVDKVIITMFSSTGVRLEAWDYFTWSDIIQFRNNNGNYKGGAVRVYHGDAEEYWTHTTPEFCRLLDKYREYWIGKYGSQPLPSDPLLAQERTVFPVRLKSRGVMKRVTKIVTKTGLRTRKVPGKNRYEVKLDHGFRKFFNTMLRRAKVYWADKEDMMGHKVGLEDSYERYEESDFERFPEYQKAIPFLTISDEERQRSELEKERLEKSELQKKVDEIEKLKELRKQDKNELETFKEEMMDKISQRILKAMGDKNIKIQ